MSEERFDIYFRGDLLEGFFVDFVRADMARLFKTDEARLAAFFSGDAQPIKLKVDKATAAKYQKALKQIGARPIIVPAGQAVPEPEAEQASGHRPAPAPTPDDEQSATADESDWTILPPGSDIGEAREAPPARVDTSALSLAEPGADLVDARTEPDPTVVDTSSLSLAEAGADLLEDGRAAPPPAPDTSHLSLDEP